MRKDCPKKWNKQTLSYNAKTSKEYYKKFEHEIIIQTYYNLHYSLMVSHNLVTSQLETATFELELSTSLHQSLHELKQPGPFQTLGTWVCFLGAQFLKKVRFVCLTSQNRCQF